MPSLSAWIAQLTQMHNDNFKQINTKLAYNPHAWSK